MDFNKDIKLLRWLNQPTNCCVILRRLVQSQIQVHPNWNMKQWKK